MGLREEKKRRTKKAISDMATLLFAERGYDAVTTAEIAERAQVSVPTLFNYFPTKESLVFDEDAETEQKLVEAVRKRKKGETMLDTLLEWGLDAFDDFDETHGAQARTFMKLVDETPALSRYAREMWVRHERALGAAIHREARDSMNKLQAEAIARFVLDSYRRAMFSPKPKVALRVLFEILRTGWRG